MKWTIVAVAGLGIVAALCASLLVAFLVARPTVNSPQVEGDVTILVAARDIPQLTLVDGQSIELRRVPRSKMPDQALTVSVEAVGKIMAVQAVAGQALRKDMFVTEGAGAQLAASLPEGMRAVAISVSEFGGLEGILYPGSVVDVILMVRGNGNDAGGAARAVLERVPVLAVERDTVVAKDAERQEGNSRQAGQSTRLVTLLVDTRQASQLELAQAEGVLSLALRNPMDKRSTDRSSVSMASLLPRENQGPSWVETVGLQFAKSLANASTAPRALPAAAPASAPAPVAVVAPVAVAPPPKPAWLTTILHGAQIEKVEFPLAPEPDGVAVGQNIEGMTHVQPFME